MNASILSYLAAALIAAGLVLNLLSVAGTLRFPDLYTRAHALGIADTLGAFLLLAGLCLLNGASLLTAKLALLLLLLFIINPTVVHAVLHAAREAGIAPWTNRP